MHTLPPLQRKRDKKIADAMNKLNTASGVNVWKSPRVTESVKQKTSDLLPKNNLCKQNFTIKYSPEWTN